MNTKFIMGASAIFMAVLSLILLFLPTEVLSSLGAAEVGNSHVMVSIAGAMLLGLAFLNWYSKSISIGGIYARPVAMANFVHFAVGALSLAKIGFTEYYFLIPVLLLYGIFGVCFGWIIFFKSN